MVASDSLLSQYLTLGNTFFALVTYIVFSLWLSAYQAPKYPSTVPRAGRNGGWLASFLDFFDSFTKSSVWMQEGYDAHNKNGKAYVLPGTLGAASEIVVPRNQISWLVEQPETILSTREAHYEILHGRYSFLDEDLIKFPFHEIIIHKALVRNTNAIIPDITEEVNFNMDQALGADTQNWKTVNIFDMFFKVVPPVANRVFVGKPLCRNEEYLANCLAFAHDVVRNMYMIFPLTPSILRPVIGYLASLPGNYRLHRTKKFTLPLIEKRLADLASKDAGEKPDFKEPQDYITWHIREAQQANRPDELAANMIAKRLLPLNFASIHTTSLTGHAAFLDILSTPPSLAVIPTLREEARRIYVEEGQTWTKAGLARMYRIDSALRESMRLNSMGGTISGRKVVAKEGITNPVEGWHAPYGTFISCPMMSIHTDADIYDDALSYDPWRYSRPREAYEALPAEQKDQAQSLKLLSTGMVTTSDTHLPFGHGQHACPGRFMASNDLKIMVAWLVMNYDVKLLDKRPETKWFGRNKIPEMSVCMEIKRREDAFVASRE